MKLNKDELSTLENVLIQKGYKKMNGHYKNETYGYWKSFDITYENDSEIIGYQSAVLIYDFNEHKLEGLYKLNPYGVQFEFLGSESKIGYSRLDMSICDDYITVDKFESICDKFYKTFKRPF